MAIRIKEKILFAAIVIYASFAWANAAHAAIVKPANNLGLTAYWNLDEGRGTTAYSHGSATTTSNGTLNSSVTWAPGKLGQAASFNGSGQYISASAAVSTTEYTFSGWIRYQGSTPISAIKVALSFGAGGSNTIWMGYASDGKLAISNSSVDLKSATVSNSTAWQHLTAVVSGGTLYAYMNGVLVTTTSIGARSANTVVMGDYVGSIGSFVFPGNVDDVRVYNRALPAGEVAALYNRSAGTRVGATASALTNGSTLNQGLAGYWSFDGADLSDKVYDRSGNGNDGYLWANPATSSATVQGKLGQALRFTRNTGSAINYVRVPDSASLKPGTGSMSVAFWIKPTINYHDGQNANIIEKTIDSANPGWGIYRDSASNLKARLSYASALIDIVAGSFSRNFATSTWAHVVLVVDKGTNTAYWYKDGVPFGSATDITALTSMSNSNPLEIGAGAQGLGVDTMGGSLDEVRIYNRVLTAAEIKQLYGQGGGKTNASGATLQNGTGLNSGLAAYWSFNGADVTDKIYDRIGGNNGYWYGGTATSTAKLAGKLGQAMRFNATTNYVNMGNVLNIGTSDWSMGAWVKVDTGNASNIMVVSKRDVSATNNPGYQLFINSTNNAAFAISDGSASRIRVDSTSPVLNDNKWHYVAVSLTRSGNGVLYVDGQPATGGSAAISSQPASVTTSSNLYIGAQDNAGSPGGFWYGSLDEVRIFNRALSAAEMKSLYNLGR